MFSRVRASSARSAARLGLAFLGLTAVTALSASAAPAVGFQKLSGHIPAAVASARSVAALGSAEPMSLALTLPLHHQAELSNLLHGLSDPSDPRYGQFLTPEQFTARYSPTPAEYDRVIAYVQSMGLRVTATHTNRTLLDVSAPAGQVEKAFGLHLRVYQSQTDGRYFYAPDAEPQVPSALASLITGVVGLSSASLRLPHFRLQSPPAISPALDPYENASAAPNQNGIGPSGGLAPAGIKAAYNLAAATQTGSGQTLGVFELDGYTASDIAAYENQFGLPAVPLQNILVDGVTGVPSATGGAAEVTLDIELQAALAPNAAKILVYEGPNTDAGVVDTYSRIAADNSAKEISTSWGEAENYVPTSVFSSENASFQQMAAQGQSVFAASGDSGAKDNGSSLSVDDPSSQPYMVGVGGTSLTTNGAGGPYQSESTWNNNVGAGGGGVSTVWAIPSYQSSLAGSPASEGSTTYRNVPDVSLDADPYTGYSIYYNGGWTVYGGTSCAAPLWASFTALVNQSRLAAGSSLLGFADTPLYALASSRAYANDFHDIADGSSNRYFPAVTGYDDATGLGTFNGANLLADLSGSPATAPTTINDTNTGLAYAGSGWNYYPNRGVGDISNDVHATSVNGDAVSYSFTGTGIKYVTETCYDEGNVQVYIDGVLQATVNCYSAARASQQTVYSASGLTQGSHTLKLVKASGSYMLLDALLVTTTPSTALNDTDSGIAYTGSGWGYYPNRGVGDISNDVHATSVNGDAASYTFTGTGIKYVTETCYDEGNVQVYIDGVLQTTINCYSSTRQSQQTVYTASGLTQGQHTLKLVKASGSYMLLDALSLQ